MLKKLIGTGIIISSFCFATSAFADYNPSGDKTIQITTSSNTTGILNQKTADLSVGVQESVYNTIYNETGMNIDHSYIWINVNGQNVLAIDPPEPWL